ncbi:MAG: hypothetical protein JWP11_2927 [Frankiales bacterium]|nr:hypothetical protein [Frankiales bacterium]
MTVRPKPGPHQTPGSAFDRAVRQAARTSTADLSVALTKAAARRRAVGDNEAARLADAWAAELGGAA